MPNDSPLYPKDEPTRTATGPIRCPQATEAALVAAEARVAVLEQQLAAAVAQAQHYQTRLTALVHNRSLGLLPTDATGRMQVVDPCSRGLIDLPADPSVTASASEAIHLAEVVQDPAFKAWAQALPDAEQITFGEQLKLANSSCGV